LLHKKIPFLLLKNLKEERIFAVPPLNFFVEFSTDFVILFEKI